MPPRLTANERLAALANLAGWQACDGRDAIAKRFIFTDFTAAFGWMVRVAHVCEQLDHHPEWSNIYRTVDVTLSTHDAGGLTALDVELASTMDRLFAQAQ